MITSKDNPSFKQWKKLKLKKFRDQTNLFLVYGPHLIQKAKEANAISQIITSNPNLEGIVISEELIAELNQTETAFDQIAVCKKTNLKLKSNRILALDDIQDPNNVGALIRSASAFGFDHIIFSNKTADLYNEKVIRASQGSIFDVYVERANLVTKLIDLKNEGYQIFIADAHGITSSTINKPERLIIVLGNEGSGISPQVKDIADGSLTINTNKVESLNVSVAGSILMYEWR